MFEKDLEVQTEFKGEKDDANAYRNEWLVCDIRRYDYPTNHYVVSVKVEDDFSGGRNRDPEAGIGFEEQYLDQMIEMLQEAKKRIATMKKLHPFE